MPEVDATWKAAGETLQRDHSPAPSRARAFFLHFQPHQPV